MPKKPKVFKLISDLKDLKAGIEKTTIEWKNDHKIDVKYGQYKNCFELVKK